MNESSRMGRRNFLGLSAILVGQAALPTSILAWQVAPSQSKQTAQKSRLDARLKAANVEEQWVTEISGELEKGTRFPKKTTYDIITKQRALEYSPTFKSNTIETTLFGKPIYLRSNVFNEIQPQRSPDLSGI